VQNALDIRYAVVEAWADNKFSIDAIENTGKFKLMKEFEDNELVYTTNEGSKLSITIGKRSSRVYRWDLNAESKL
jgi:hypothetical protein